MPPQPSLPQTLPAHDGVQGGGDFFFLRLSLRFFLASAGAGQCATPNPMPVPERLRRMSRRVGVLVRLRATASNVLVFTCSSCEAVRRLAAPWSHLVSGRPRFQDGIMASGPIVASAHAADILDTQDFSGERRGDTGHDCPVARALNLRRSAVSQTSVAVWVTTSIVAFSGEGRRREGSRDSAQPALSMR
jgi:hypothetical protein